ncbi:MAG: hypothetical protein AVDCRST_MAG87-3485, partial [uncultured Thermomicrobiales bacterium]
APPEPCRSRSGVHPRLARDVVAMARTNRFATMTCRRASGSNSIWNTGQLRH